MVVRHSGIGRGNIDNGGTLYFSRWLINAVKSALIIFPFWHRQKRAGSGDSFLWLEVRAIDKSEVINTGDHIQFIIWLCHAQMHR